MNVFALVDCNNFYAACERLFDPSLADRPVVVLSNNDGCVVARCARAKALGIPMGIPFFQIRKWIRDHHVAVRSSNYELYGDMSDRVMKVLMRFCPEIEIYSIDEAFLVFDARRAAERLGWADEIRNTVLRWVGIPVSIGIGMTKTLAKAANRRAKRCSRGVWSVYDADARRILLRDMPIRDVWGIGRRHARTLEAGGIATAEAFVEQLDAQQVRRLLTVTGLRIWHELRGRSCLAMEEVPPARQSVCVSRTFGAAQTEPDGIRTAVAGFAAAGAEKLRRGGQVAPLIQVFLSTSPFRDNGPGHCPVGQSVLDPPTNDTLEIVSVAGRLAGSLFRRGYAYQKAGVIFSGLRSDARIQENFLDPVANRPLRRELMRGLDAINRRFGRGTVVPASALSAKDDTWTPRREFRSPRYTTRWDEIPVVR